jgi:hypothetical protein
MIINAHSSFLTHDVFDFFKAKVGDNRSYFFTENDLPAASQGKKLIIAELLLKMALNTPYLSATITP